MELDQTSLYNSIRLNDPKVITMSTETHLSRGVHVLRAVAQTYNPDYNNVLEIGVGAKGYVLVCPYEPYFIAAALEGTNYDLTIIEPNTYIVDDLLRRQNIYHVPLNEPHMEEDDLVWDQYLALVWEESRIVKYAENDLVFPYWIKDRDIDSIQEQGILSAPIPASFRDGLVNGGINIYNQSVENFNWNTIPDQSLTLGVIQNVLNFLKERDQRRALSNLREKLTPEGKVLVTGFRIVYPSMDFVFKGRYGGWVDDQSLAEIGLQVLPEDRWTDNENYSMWLLSRL